MVQSKGTRPDSHLLRMDFTGRRKYSGRSPDVRRVGVAGEMEARGAMPTSGAAVLREAPGTASVAKAVSFRKSCALRSGSPQVARMTDGGQSEPPLFEILSGAMLPGPRSGA